MSDTDRTKLVKIIIEPILALLACTISTQTKKTKQNCTGELGTRARRIIDVCVLSISIATAPQKATRRILLSIYYYILSHPENMQEEAWHPAHRHAPSLV